MSKTDKELLELAAKAVGLKLQYNFLGNFDVRQNWDPLTNDGDALRLAVDLRIDVIPGFSDDAVAITPKGYQCYEMANKDKHDATRRAIVRAAAAIGEGME